MNRKNLQLGSPLSLQFLEFVPVLRRQKEGDLLDEDGEDEEIGRDRMRCD
jgi:hypothetical protein